MKTAIRPFKIGDRVTVLGCRHGEMPKVGRVCRVTVDVGQVQADIEGAARLRWYDAAQLGHACPSCGGHGWIRENGCQDCGKTGVDTSDRVRI